MYNNILILWIEMSGPDPLLTLFCVWLFFFTTTMNVWSGLIPQSSEWDAVIVDSSISTFVGRHVFDKGRELDLNLRIRSKGKEIVPDIISFRGSQVGGQIGVHHIIGVKVIDQSFPIRTDVMPQMCHYSGTWTKNLDQSARLFVQPNIESYDCPPIDIYFETVSSSFYVLMTILYIVAFVRCHFFPGQIASHMFEMPACFDTFINSASIMLTMGFFQGLYNRASDPLLVKYMSTIPCALLDIPVNVFPVCVLAFAVTVLGLNMYWNEPPSLRTISEDDVFSIEGLHAFFQNTFIASIILSIICYNIGCHILVLSPHIFAIIQVSIHLIPIWMYKADTLKLKPWMFHPPLCATAVCLQLISATWILLPGVGSHLSSQLLGGDAFLPSYSNSNYGFSIFRFLISKEIWPIFAWSLLIFSIGLPAHIFIQIIADRPQFSFSLPSNIMSKVSKKYQKNNDNNKLSTVTPSAVGLETGHCDGSDSVEDEFTVECTICLCDIEFDVTHNLRGLHVASSKPSETFISTPCDHVFHVLCLETWTKQKLECPNCRRAFVETMEGFTEMKDLAKSIREQSADEKTSENGNNISVAPEARNEDQTSTRGFFGIDFGFMNHPLR